jgi:mevalonate kinase
MKQSKGVASAPAKVILFGEHFVVYGSPALLAAIDRHTTVQSQVIDQKKIVITSDIGVSAEYSDSRVSVLKGGKKARTILDPIYDAVKRAQAGDDKIGLSVRLKSRIPYGIGLGSSAASCVASIAAVDSLLGPHTKDWICDRAIESERMIHRNSSGADCYVSTFGGVLRYSKTDGYKRVAAKKHLRLVVSSTGIRHSTGVQVESVGIFREANLERFAEMSRQAADICGEALGALETGDIDNLGRLMTMNQQLLRQIGVSHKKTEALIELNLKAGALGAKITGAGGGGAVIALAGSQSEGEKIAAGARRKGYDSMLVEIDRKGLVI